jgi:hypothetical protein
MATLGPFNDQLLLAGAQPIQTGTFVTKAIDIEFIRRLSVTVAVQGTTGLIGGGFSGTLVVQGTDEIPGNYGGTGTPWACGLRQPATNGQTGALYWTPVPSGTISIGPVLNSGNYMQFQMNDVNHRFVRVAFNTTATGSSATGTLGGSGTMVIFMTGKPT